MDVQVTGVLGGGGFPGDTAGYRGWKDLSNSGLGVAAIRFDLEFGRDETPGAGGEFAGRVGSL
jgi:hypothetical protein